MVWAFAAPLALLYLWIEARMFWQNYRDFLDGGGI